MLEKTYPLKLVCIVFETSQSSSVSRSAFFAFWWNYSSLSFLYSEFPTLPFSHLFSLPLFLFLSLQTIPNLFLPHLSGFYPLITPTTRSVFPILFISFQILVLRMFIMLVLVFFFSFWILFLNVCCNWGFSTLWKLGSSSQLTSILGLLTYWLSYKFDLILWIQAIARLNHITLIFFYVLSRIVVDYSNNSFLFYFRVVFS